MDIASAPIIMAIILAIVTLLKTTLKKHVKFLAFIPLIALGLGLILSVIAFYTMPEILPVDNIFNAIIMGIFSGMTASGSTEMLKGFINLKQSTTEQKNDDTTKIIVENKEAK